jgi:hypothetical protein
MSNITVPDQKLNDSLLNFSATGTEQDSDYLAQQIVEKTNKLKNLQSDVVSPNNTRVLIIQCI